MAEMAVIYRLRSQVESALKKAFEAMSFDVVTRENKPDNFQQVRPRLEIKCSIGAATGHKAICQDGFTRFDCFRLGVAIQAVSNINKDAPWWHEQYVAKVREFCSTIAALSVTDVVNFPLIRLAIPLRDSGTTDYLKSEEGIEYSTLDFQSVVQIRPEAWPVVGDVQWVYINDMLRHDPIAKVFQMKNAAGEWQSVIRTAGGMEFI